MDYTEIINKAAADYCTKNELEDESDGYTYACNLATESTRAFIAGLNSPLAKQITEIEVVKGKIEVLKWVNPILVDDIVKIDSKIEQLEQLRDKLINELKLK